MSHIDVEHRTASDPVVGDCEQARRLLAAYRDGLARLSASPAGEAAAHGLERLCTDYEDQALRVQQRSARGHLGLIAKGEQLEALLDHKAAALDEGVLRAVKLYIADVRRVSHAPRLVWARETTGICQQSSEPLQSQRESDVRASSPASPWAETGMAAGD
jgi:hypothetical protein